MARRFLQFRLRTMLIAMVVLAAPLGWWSYKAERQRRAVETLWARHATVLFNFTDRSNFKSPFLHWRYRVTQVGLDWPPTDSDLAALQSLDDLEYVAMNWGNDDDFDRVRRALPPSTTVARPLHALGRPRD